MYPYTVSFRHLERMTDDTGLLEHSLGMIPRRKEGYTTDDNARALWVCLEWLHYYSLIPNESQKEKLFHLIDRYLAFLLWAQREDGHFHNNFAYDRTPEPERPSDDCLGRALWASAITIVKLRHDQDRLLAAEQIFDKGMEPCAQMAYPRGWAYALAACSLLAGNLTKIKETLERWGAGMESVLRSRVRLFENKLTELYRCHARAGWHWFEPVMTYSNGVFPWAMLHAYNVTEKQETRQIAKESLDFLIEKMTAPQGWIRPIGNRGWCTEETRSKWDQQPIEVMKLALASAQAYRVLGDLIYWEVLNKCRSWFYGNNDWQTPLVNFQEGSCHDGLTPKGINGNQGAESTIAYLLTEANYSILKLEVEANVCCV
ncbi:glycosyl transferase [Aneurinibacillus thermoaerophilus]|uniref:Glycosyl transferase n=1 Tax=Aneurinibacillus thermoaerophilus TaxID=143495 RepID=A0ABX8YEJ2_ANETH|nr:glycosyl transferase [Aneurinibacillus thermoaerophilus]QYY44153.1 glycosyl transferase [Aneurinibacillus thermoaerophilus]